MASGHFHVPHLTPEKSCHLPSAPAPLREQQEACRSSESLQVGIWVNLGELTDLYMSTVLRTLSHGSILLGPLPHPLKLASVPWLLLCLLKVTLQGQAMGERPKPSSVSDWASTVFPAFMSDLQLMLGLPNWTRLSPVFYHPGSDPTSAPEMRALTKARDPQPQDKKCPYKPLQPCSPEINFAVSFQ